MSILDNCSPDSYFFLRNSIPIKNCSQLADELKNVEDSVYDYHVNGQKNDIAEWVRKTYQDYKLAKWMLRAKSREQMVKLLERRVMEVQIEEEEKKRDAQKSKEKYSGRMLPTHGYSHALAERREAWHEQHAFSLGTTATALLVLAGTLAFIDMANFTQGGITGAAIYNMNDYEFTNLGMNWLVIGISLAGVLIYIFRSLASRRSYRLP